jgi:hypothetical protein
MARALPVLLLTLAGSLVSLACGGGEPIIECDAANKIQPFCGFKNPEDLLRMPEYVNVIVVSQFGGIDGANPGEVLAWDTSNGVRRIMVPPHGGREILDPRGQGWDPWNGMMWGDPTCPGPPGPEFSPHGIDLRVRDDGHTMLLVVNHGGRESIEFFQVLVAGGHSGAIWRGCALAPDDSNFNDVSVLPDGGFVTTRMMSLETNLIWQFISAAFFGSDTGWVWEWQPGSGFKRLPGTDGPMPNGIATSPDGSELFVNMYAAGEVRKISRPGGDLLGVAEGIPGPDNIAWDEAGEKLLVASHLGSALDCAGVEEGACGMEFQIVELDPASMDARTVYRNKGAPMGAVTVALQRGRNLWFGTFQGDRLGGYGLYGTTPDEVSEDYEEVR